jgi:hypothetical protein
VRRMDWSRLPRKFLKSWVDAPCCRVRGRAHSYGHGLTRELQLIGFKLNVDRAAVLLGVSLSWGAAAQDRQKWRKLAARLPTAGACGNKTHLRTSVENWARSARPGHTAIYFITSSCSADSSHC